MEVFATLRIYAIWNRNIPLSLLILLLNLIPVVSNTVREPDCFVVSVRGSRYVYPKYDFGTDTIAFFVDPIAGPQCFESSKLSNTLNFRRESPPYACSAVSLIQHGSIVSLATRIALMVADALVLLLTWIKTFGVKTSADKYKVNTPFLTLILRDGE